MDLQQRLNQTISYAPAQTTKESCELRKRLIESQRSLMKLMDALKTCDARTRDGGFCMRKPSPGHRRCVLHGSKSTGPKSPEGKQRVAEASRQRMLAFWATKRKEESNEPG